MLYTGMHVEDSVNGSVNGMGWICYFRVSGVQAERTPSAVHVGF